jgi:phage shock protein E
MPSEMLTLDELHQRLSQLGSEDIILDVRRPDEYQEAHIANALNIPVDEVAARAEELKKYKTVYIHCKRGGRAKTAFETLKAAKLDNLVCVHDAGMDQWLEKGYPAVRA